MAKGTQEHFRRLCFATSPCLCLRVTVYQSGNTVQGHGWVCFLLDAYALKLPSSNMTYSSCFKWQQYLAFPQCPPVARKKNHFRSSMCFRTFTGMKMVFNVQINKSYKLCIFYIETIQNDQVQ